MKIRREDLEITITIVVEGNRFCSKVSCPEEVTEKMFNTLAEASDFASVGIHCENKAKTRSIEASLYSWKEAVCFLDDVVVK